MRLGAPARRRQLDVHRGLDELVVVREREQPVEEVVDDDEHAEVFDPAVLERFRDRLPWGNFG